MTRIYIGNTEIDQDAKSAWVEFRLGQYDNNTITGPLQELERTGWRIVEWNVVESDEGSLDANIPRDF